MVSAVKTDRDRSYDFIKWYVEERYCFTSARIKNNGTADLAAGQVQPGWPMFLSGGVQNVALAAQKDTFTGFFADPKKCEAIDSGDTSVESYRILVRGPALVNKTVIPTLDQDGGALTSANIVAQARVLGIEMLVEPTKQEIQTT